MTRTEIISMLIDEDETLIFFEPAELFDHAILGLTTSSPGWDMPAKVCYSSRMIVEKLAAEFDGNYEEAIDYFGFNVAGFGCSDPPPPLLIADWDVS